VTLINSLLMLYRRNILLTKKSTAQIHSFCKTVIYCSVIGEGIGVIWESQSQAVRGGSYDERRRLAVLMRAQEEREPHAGEL
jgi:hypothetical protein